MFLSQYMFILCQSIPEWLHSLSLRLCSAALCKYAANQLMILKSFYVLWKSQLPV